MSSSNVSNKYFAPLLNIDDIRGHPRFRIDNDDVSRTNVAVKISEAVEIAITYKR